MTAAEIFAFAIAGACDAADDAGLDLYSIQAVRGCEHAPLTILINTWGTTPDVLKMFDDLDLPMSRTTVDMPESTGRESIIRGEAADGSYRLIVDVRPKGLNR